MFVEGRVHAGKLKEKARRYGGRIDIGRKSYGNDGGADRR